MENYSRPATGFRQVLTLFACVLSLAGGIAPAEAQQSKISNTKHNLSSSGSTAPGTVKATTESQICVFCHTPHAANIAAPAPLWNRTLSSATYTPYTSNSLDAEAILGSALAQPGGSSKLCLSCHDGTMAIGTVGVLGGNTNVSVTMSNTDAGKMPTGLGTTTGFTRNLGIDLRNDHPISFTYDDALATRDGELRHMDAQQRYPEGSSTSPVIGIRSAGVRPALPLQPTGTAGAGQVQCTTCHDPHLDVPKFLRLNRLQKVNPAGAEFLPANDQICLGCHNKLGTAWSQSSHASETIGDETYKTDAANRREFLLGGKASIKVWEAGCLNCHDTHAVQGTRRLLREGVLGGSGGAGAGSYKLGWGSEFAPNSKSAIEETCYQCHTTAAESVLNAGIGTVPDIKTDFTTLARRMPIATSEQASGVESHDIKDSNFTEARETLGSLNIANRHAECTDCHNPHRVTRNSLFNRQGTDQRTHVPGGANGNLASGALRGTFGVEPVYTGTGFFDLPNSYTEKKGDGGVGAATTVGSAWVTREYQICLKCHSDYGYPDDNTYPSGTKRPELGTTTNLTPANPDGVRTSYTRYTNQAREFQPNNATGATGAGTSYQTGNYRSWHPVIGPTGRTLTNRGITGTSPWRSPWTDNVGTQTMYCTDCHGSNASGSGTPPITPDSGVWGPHGSANNFILKGIWGPTMGATGQDSGETTNLLCFKCHDSAVYTTRSDSGRRSGFYDGSSGKGNLHNYHVDRIKKLYCTWCHVAVPHGWKNKMLLVNLNDVGPEAGQTGSKQVATNSSSSTYNVGPYYANAKLKIVTFAQSGNWSASNCGAASGSTIIANSQGGTTNTSGTGKNWMTSTCSNPP
ncbi:MAG: hypothetical protein AzoDbin1_02244 [Azoarcus sp.]|nr:hypothetical protein [Azoarcus sp.]